MSRWFWAAVAVVVLLIIAIPTAYVVALKSSAKYVTVTVESKDAVTKDNSNQYRIYTDRGVYVIADTLVFWNWRSADRYQDLKPGTTYRCLSAGWRIGFFSAFPNLIDCEAV